MAEGEGKREKFQNGEAVRNRAFEKMGIAVYTGNRGKVIFSLIGNASVCCR